MSKKIKIIAIAILSVLMFTSSMFFAVAEKQKKYAVTYITNNTFEDEIITPWIGAGWSTHSITSDSYNGNKALLSTKNSGESQNRVQAYFDEGDSNGEIKKGNWNNISFYAKVDEATSINMILLVYLSNDNSRQISLINDDDISTSYSNYSCGFSAIEKEGKLEIEFERPGVGYNIVDRDVSVPDGVVITEYCLFIYTDSNLLYVDDLFIFNEVETIEKISENTIYNTYEDEEMSPWGSSGTAIHSITNESKNGEKALLSSKVEGETQNRVQAYFYEGKELGKITSGIWHDFSFYAKSNEKSVLNVIFLVYLSNDESRQISLIIDSEINTNYDKYETGFNAYISNQKLNVEWKRPDVDSILSDDSIEAPNGTTITEYCLFLYTSTEKLYVDDIKINREIDKPETKIVDKILLQDNMEKGVSGIWKGGLDNSISKLSTTEESNSGKYAIKATRINDDGENRIQTNISKGNDGLENGVWYKIGMNFKSSMTSKISMVISINTINEKQRTIYMISDMDISTAYNYFECGISFKIEDNKIKVDWKRPDTNVLHDESVDVVDDDEIKSIDLIIIGNSKTLFFDDFVMSSKVELDYDLGEIVEDIYNVNNINDARELFVRYSELSEDDKKYIVNYNILLEKYRDYMLENGLEQGDFNENNVVFSFGAISDIHNHNFEKALDVLNGWSDKVPDALVMAGDLTDNVQYGNSLAEIENIKNAMNQKLDSGTETFFCLGNHDSSNSSHANDFYNGLGERFYRTDLDLNQAKNKGNRHSLIKGYHFIAIEADYELEIIPDENLAFLDTTLKSIVNSSDYDGKYIFVVCHVSPANSVFGCSPIKDIDRVLNNYPQVILLTGHSHYPINDERSILQNKYTIINLGSVSYMSFDPSYIECNEYGLIDESYDLSVGAMIDIDDIGNVKITRIDFTNNKQIKSSWILSAPKQDRSNLLSYPMERATKFNQSPKFNENSVINAKYKLDNSVEISFDRAIDEDMIFSYVVELFKGDENTPYKIVESLSEFYLYPNLADMPQKKIITLKELPDKIKVYAKDSYGALSSCLETNVNKTENTNVVDEECFQIDANQESYYIDSKYEISLTENFENKLENVGKINDYIGEDIYIREAETSTCLASKSIKIKINYLSLDVPEENEIYEVSMQNNSKFEYLKGAMVSFNINLKEGKEDYNLTVKINGQEITPTDDCYSFIISEDSQIVVEYQKPVFNIVMPVSTNYSITYVGENKIEKNGNFEFSIILNDEYSKSNIIVKANNNIITKNSDNKYIIQNITENISITIDGVELNKKETSCKSYIGFEFGVVLLFICLGTILFIKSDKKIY